MGVDWRWGPQRVQTLPLLLRQEGDPSLTNVELSTRLRLHDRLGLTGTGAGTFTSPGPELARHLRISDTELRDAQLAEMAFLPSSLDEPLSAWPGAGTLADLLGTDDPRIEHILSMQSVATHWRELPACEREILLLRFYSGLTQVQIGDQLGMSQMQVSRRLGHALGYLRRRLLGQ